MGKEFPTECLFVGRFHVLQCFAPPCGRSTIPADEKKNQKFGKEVDEMLLNYRPTYLRLPTPTYLRLPNYAYLPTSKYLPILTYLPMTTNDYQRLPMTTYDYQRLPTYAYLTTLTYQHLHTYQY